MKKYIIACIVLIICINTSFAKENITFLSDEVIIQLPQIESNSLIYTSLSFIPSMTYSAIGLSINYETKIYKMFNLRLGYGYSQSVIHAQNWGGDSYTFYRDYNGFLGMINFVIPEDNSRFILGIGYAHEMSDCGWDKIMIPIAGELGYRYQSNKSGQVIGVGVELAYGMIGLNFSYGFAL